MGKTTIEWTQNTNGTPGFTFNPWRGCTKVSQGCKHCYAETLSKRNPSTLGIWGPRGTRSIAAENYWKQPIKWNADAIKAGERRRVFCASLADVFEGPETMPVESVEAVDAARTRLFTLIDSTPNLDWLLLTKRPENIMGFLRETLNEASFPSNVWIGTSVEDQATADERIPHLLKVPAAVRFLSCEPLLGPVDLRRWLGIHADDCLSSAPLPTGMGNWHCTCGASSHTDSSIDWVICGGESGSGARPMHPDWVRSLRDQCNAADVSFLFKQWGEYAPSSQVPTGTPEPKAGPRGRRQLDALKKGFGAPNPDHIFWNLGKHAAGRLLDGREWNEFPT